MESPVRAQRMFKKGETIWTPTPVHRRPSIQSNAQTKCKTQGSQRSTRVKSPQWSCGFRAIRFDPLGRPDHPNSQSKFYLTQPCVERDCPTLRASVPMAHANPMHCFRIFRCPPPPGRLCPGGIPARWLDTGTSLSPRFRPIVYADAGGPGTEQRRSYEAAAALRQSNGPRKSVPLPRLIIRLV